MKRRPALTIGIPTFNRPQMLPNALRTAINQTRPVRVILTDNGEPGPTEEILVSDEFKSADITYIKTEQPGAWPNWRAAAAACTTKYFAWLQDDDVIRDTYASRVIDVMDYFPDVNVWMARLACAYGPELGIPFKGNCPWVPMDLMSGRPSRWMGGEVIAASSYATSWSLSPAQAFRCNDRFFDALEEMPEHAEIFIERLFPARLCVDAPIVADPIVAGYWVQHMRMLHLQQNADRAESLLQLNNSYACLDRIMDDIEAGGADWRKMLRNWLGWIPFDILKGWLDLIKKYPKELERGRYLDEIVGILKEPILRSRRIGREIIKREKALAESLLAAEEASSVGKCLALAGE